MSQVPGTFVAFALGGFVSDGQNSDELTVRAERQSADDVEVILLALPLTDTTVLAMSDAIASEISKQLTTGVVNVNDMRDAMTKVLTRGSA